MVGKDIWFLSDHHFFHKNIIKFTGADGKLIRPGFSCIEEMNELIVQNHNNVVKPGSKVYFGGDVGRNFGPLLKRMNGRKRLILGNHDCCDFATHREELASFDKILSWRYFGNFSKRFVVSHYPLHPMSFIYRGSQRDEAIQQYKEGREPNCYNVHGHLHSNLVELDNGHIDTRYYSICCEYQNYTPIHVEDLIKKLGKPQAMRNRP